MTSIIAAAAIVSDCFSPHSVNTSLHTSLLPPSNTLIANQKLVKSVTPSQLTIERIYTSPSLTGVIPKGLTLSPDGSRLLFLLAKEEDQKQFDIWEYDLTSKTKQILVDSKTLHPNEEKLSEEEISQRERLRLSDHGIVAYKWSTDGQTILFSVGGIQYLLDFTLSAPQPVALPLCSGSHPIDVDLSPDKCFLSFVRDHNLMIYDLISEQEMQLTKDGSETISNGLAEFIAQEELGRFKGYWWSPDSKKIAYVQVDESPIKVTQRCEIGFHGDVTITSQRYPFAGSPNVIFKVGILDIETQKTTWVDLGEDKDCYLARVNWLEDSGAIAIQLLNRNQKTLDLFFADASKGTSSLILREESQTWVNVHDDLKFIDSCFLWSSERSGFRHLYLYDLSGNLIRQLTAGDWAVKKIIGINHENVFFEAFAKNPLEKHLYVTSLKKEAASNIQQITSNPGWHNTAMDKHCQYYLDTFSNVITLPQVSLHRTDGSRICYVEENALNLDHPYTPFASQHIVPEFGQIPTHDGQLLYYRMLKPIHFNPTKRYPVIITTYGGPGNRLVTNSWISNPGQYWEQLMAHQGYIMFTLDNRGSTDRGKQFEDPIYQRLGEEEFLDQKTGALFLQQLPYVDPERIGIFGWSYGGYLTLMSLLKGSEIFKAGVAVAPVTDWKLYDTCYTERYLGLPSENHAGYYNSSIFSHIHNKVGKLLLVHGMADDNVLFTHTIQLIRALQEKQVPFDLMTYPGSKHGITETNARIHLYTKITEFFDRHLRSN